ncbi:MAG TPA: TOBE domain-containing protein [Coriobacteriia bacterium]
MRPEDVVLFEPSVPLPATADRNRIDGIVAEVSSPGVTMSVLVDVGGVRISSSVSRSTAASLAVAPGSAVAAVFRTTAVRVKPR